MKPTGQPPTYAQVSAVAPKPPQPTAPASTQRQSCSATTATPKSQDQGQSRSPPAQPSSMNPNVFIAARSLVFNPSSLPSAETTKAPAAEAIPPPPLPADVWRVIVDESASPLLDGLHLLHSQTHELFPQARDVVLAADRSKVAAAVAAVQKIHKFILCAPMHGIGRWIGLQDAAIPTQGCIHVRPATRTREGLTEVQRRWAQPFWGTDVLGKWADAVEAFGLTSDGGMRLIPRPKLLGALIVLAQGEGLEVSVEAFPPGARCTVTFEAPSAGSRDDPERTVAVAMAKTHLATLGITCTEGPEWTARGCSGGDAIAATPVSAPGRFTVPTADGRMLTVTVAPRAGNSSSATPPTPGPKKPAAAANATAPAAKTTAPVAKTTATAAETTAPATAPTAQRDEVAAQVDGVGHPSTPPRATAASPPAGSAAGALPKRPPPSRSLHDAAHMGEAADAPAVAAPHAKRRAQGHDGAGSAPPVQAPTPIPHTNALPLAPLPADEAPSGPASAPPTPPRALAPVLERSRKLFEQGEWAVIAGLVTQHMERLPPTVRAEKIAYLRGRETANMFLAALLPHSNAEDLAVLDKQRHNMTKGTVLALDKRIANLEPVEGTAAQAGTTHG